MSNLQHFILWFKTKAWLETEMDDHNGDDEVSYIKFMMLIALLLLLCTFH